MLPTFSAYRGRDWGINKLSKLQGMCSRSRSQTQSPQPHTSLFSLLHVTSGNACCVKCEGNPANIHQIPADHVSVRVETTVGSSGPGGAYAQVENRGQLWVSSSVTFHPIFWNKVYYFDLLSQQGCLSPRAGNTVFLWGLRGQTQALLLAQQALYWVKKPI